MTATLTVGENALGWLGYNRTFGYGTLSETQFTHDGETVTLGSLYFDGDNINLEFDTGLGDGTFILELDDASIDLGGTGRLGFFSVATSDIDWSAGDTVTVKLFETGAELSDDATLSEIRIVQEPRTRRERARFPNEMYVLSLSPNFRADTLTYTAMPANSVITFVLVATASDSGASITITLPDGMTGGFGGTVDGGFGNEVVSEVAIEGFGNFTFTIDVEAADGTTRTYTVTVPRQPERPKGESRDTRMQTLELSANADATALERVEVLGHPTVPTGTTQTVTLDFFATVSYDTRSVEVVAGPMDPDAELRLLLRGGGSLDVTDTSPWRATLDDLAHGVNVLHMELEPPNYDFTRVHRLRVFRPPPVTATLEPAGTVELVGNTYYRFELTTSEPVAYTLDDLRDNAFTVTGGSIFRARTVHNWTGYHPYLEEERRTSDHFYLDVRPAAPNSAVSVTLLADRLCRDGGLCDKYGARVENAPTLTMSGENTGDQIAADPLTARVPDAPREHDGATPLTFELRFSDDVTISAEDMRDHALSVTGGTVTGAVMVGGGADRWEITITPSGTEDMIFSIPPTSSCSDVGALCTAYGFRLASLISLSVAYAPPAVVPLTAEFTGVPDEHDGSSAFTFRLAFSEAIRTGYKVLRDRHLSASGGTVTRARRVDGRSDLWEIEVEPSGNDAVAVTLAVGDRCAAAPCTSDGRALSETVTATIEGPFSLPTVSVSDAGATEGGVVEFTVSLSETSSRQVTVAYTTSGGTAESGNDFTAQSGTLTFAAGESSKTVSVSSTEDSLDEEDETFTLTLSGPANATLGAATATGTITDDDDAAPPPALSVADATVDEGPNAKLRFEITLDRASSETVTVEASTSDGTATAGPDYRAKTLRKTFAAGETRKTAVVTVLDDLHDEGAETLTLTLSNASGALVADGEAIGTIENHDPLPRALMARFGRTAAVHVVEHVEERIEAPRQPGFRGRFAGRELRPGMERELALSFLSRLGGSTGASGHGVGVHDPMGMPGVGAGPSGASEPGGSRLGMAAAAGPMGGMSGLGGPTGTAVGPRAGPLAGGLSSMGLGGGNLLTGSALSLNRETRQGGILSFWSRGARSHFSGRDEALSLGGDVQTTMFGADYAKGPLVAGLSLSHSRGLGEYVGVAGGQVASAVTGLYPWLGYKATDRITVWGVAGYGAGGMLLSPAGGTALEAGLSMKMAAAGARGDLVAGGADGFGLAFKADVLRVGTASEGVDGPGGRLAATAASVSRVRTALEGSRGLTLRGRLSLRPSVEVGLRHDAGDAETGAGLDLGVGLVVSDASTGLAVDLRVRTLLVHEDAGFHERGVALSLSYDPTPSTPLGFNARLAPSWGGQAASGAEALWGRDTMAGLAHGAVAQGSRMDAEVGYGLPVGVRFVGTPRVGFGASDHGRDYRLGYGLGVLSGERLNLELGVDARRRESPLAGGANSGVLGRVSLGW